MRVARGLLLLGMLLVPASLPSPAAADHGNAAEAFRRAWERTDILVSTGEVDRTWMWGPAPITGVIHEPYAESENGVRNVQYYDKSRMEITHLSADRDAEWYVTNGLLAIELITGRVQLGDGEYAQFLPADVVVAGDLDDPTSPTYRSMNAVLGDAPGNTGDLITARLSRDGEVTYDPSLAALGVTVGPLVPATNHAIATPFWEFMTSDGPVFEEGQLLSGQLFPSPYFATGLPITEAYWADVLVDREAQPVLFQCFERRCLTYTPQNEPGWQVEAGNVGLHYSVWRYETIARAPDSTPPDCLPGTGPIYTGRELRQPVFAGLSLECADFSGSLLVQPNFTGADLRGADFRDAHLQQPVFQGAVLNGAAFDGATLVLPAFERATLVEADFTDATLRLSQFVGTYLAGADLRSAEIIAPAFVNAICPDGSNSNRTGGTCLGNLDPVAVGAR